MGKESSYTLQTVTRGAQVLNLLSRHDSFTLKDTCQELQMNSTVAYRLLQTWVELGYLHYNQGKRVYSAGLTLVHLATKARLMSGVPELERRLKEVSNKVNQTASAAILVDVSILYIARNVVTKALTFQVEVGSTLPAYATSMGHLLLAYRPQDWVRQKLIGHTLPPLTEHTLSNVDDLMLELQRVREQGYVLSSQQLEVGVTAVAVPVKNQEDKVVAAINAAGNSAQFTSQEIHDRILPVLLEAAEKPLELDLGDKV
jgi:IclR family pca regulon transcriptional regulator